MSKPSRKYLPCRESHLVGASRSDAPRQTGYWRISPEHFNPCTDPTVRHEIEHRAESEECNDVGETLVAFRACQSRD